MPDNQFTCPVCGYPELREPAYDKFECSSFEICPSCGTEFGLDDSHATVPLADMHSHLRQQWADKGFPWTGEEDKPEGWNPARQLASAGLPIPHRRSPTGPAIAFANVPIEGRVAKPVTSRLQLFPSETRVVLRRLAGNSAVISDSLHESVADAYNQAEKEFGVSSRAWVRAKATGAADI